MSRRGRDDEPFLFDLPLVPEEEPRRARREGERAAEPPAEEGSDSRALDEPGAEGFAAERAAWPPPAARAAAPAADPAAEELPLFAADPFAEEDDFPFAAAGARRAAAPARPAVPAPAPAGRPAIDPTIAPGDPDGWDVVDSEDGDAAAALAASPPAAAAAAPELAPLLPRLAAAGLDGVALGSIAALALIGATLLDVRPGAAMLPGLALLLLVFSFAYAVVPLAFWGATPGMAAAHLVARDRDGGPLTFGQTALRWLAGVLTLLLAGLPLLLALMGRRSFADRLSRSVTWRRR